MARHEQPAARRSRFWYGFATVWTWLWGVLTGMIVLVAAPEWLGFVPAEDIEGGIIAAVVSVAMTGAGGLTAWALAQIQPSAPPRPLTRFQVPKRPGLPRPASAARQPMRRLIEAEAALVELFRRLADIPGGPADHVLEHAWEVATDTAAGLRSVAARLEAVELAARNAPRDKQAALEEASSSLLAHLDRGLDGYRSLIAAAGLLVASAPALATDELAEATESLAGALRELSRNDYRS